MAKKKKAPVESVSRKIECTSKRLRSHVERIREEAARMAALAKAMDDAGVDEITVDGHAMLLRGLNQVENFIDNATRAVREARLAMEE